MKASQNGQKHLLITHMCFDFEKLCRFNDHFMNFENDLPIAASK
jgi:hypothetical protein